MGWRLEIEVEDMGRRRTASLDFADRATLEAQLAQIDAGSRLTFGRLFEFKNEAGEMLAVVSRAYVSHAVREL